MGLSICALLSQVPLQLINETYLHFLGTLLVCWACKCIKDPPHRPGATMLDESFIQVASVIHLITVVPACLTKAKVTLNSLIHP